MRSFAVWSVVLLAETFSASSFITAPLTKFQCGGVHLKEFLDAYRARAAFLNSGGTSGPTTVPATNIGSVLYTTSVGIGNPPTYYNLIVDTGSSNTFCGTSAPYHLHGDTVNVTYTSGYFSGVEYLDQVTLAPGLVLTNQSIGDALSSGKFEGVDGILGLGPIDLTGGTLPRDPAGMIPTVMNNLASQGLVQNQVLGVYFAPSTASKDTNGALTYGGIDSSLYKDELTYAPLTETYPASAYWGINITRSGCGNHTVIPNSTAGIVDTSTTLILLADDFFTAYMQSIPGATLDPETSAIEIPDSSVPLMQPLDFLISGRNFSLDVGAQLDPIDPATASNGKRYSSIYKLGSNSGGGLDFILGMKFVERFYVVFDADAKQIGFAETNNTLNSTSF